MEYFVKFDTIKSGLSVAYFEEFPNNIVCICLYQNSEDPNEMPISVTIHCLQKYSCIGFQSTKGYYFVVIFFTRKILDVKHP